jgi:hypothetical protein
MKEKFIAKRPRSSHIGSLQGAQRTRQDQKTGGGNQSRSPTNKQIARRK